MAGYRVALNPETWEKEREAARMEAEEAEADEEDVATETKATAGKKRTSTKDKKNNLEYILTNPKSPLVNLDIFVSNIKKIEVNSAICTILILDHPGLSLC